MSQLSSVAGNNTLVWLEVLSLWCDLIEDGDNEDCGLAHTGLGLAEDILSLQSLGNGVYLNLAGMFEAALSNGPFEFVFEEKFVPTGKVGACILFLINSGLFVVGAVVIGEHVVHVVSQKIKKFKIFDVYVYK